MPFSPIPEILEDLRAGKMIVLVDDESRENEGDLVCAAEKTTPEIINFMAKHARGLICLPLMGEKCDTLNLYPQTQDNTSSFSTAFTVSIDAAHGVSTGISAADRSHTILTAIRDDCRPIDLARPGHIFPLRARTGGVLVRAGQTEGAVDLARLAGLKPAGVICEIMKDDGTMARVPDLEVFCAEHKLKMCTTAELIKYRLLSERLIERAVEIDLPLEEGAFRIIAYKSFVDAEPHLAFCLGGVGAMDEHGRPVVHPEPVLVRVHSECLTGDVFGSRRCEITDRVGEGGRRERAGAEDDLLVLTREQRVERLHFAAFDADQRMRLKRCRHRIGEYIAIHRHRAAGRHLRRFGARHDQRAQPPHLLM
jgi:3,4-dihydroxy 2-butanone 4-phosphate synthase/GTP cyclohydrolase II